MRLQPQTNIIGLDRQAASTSFDQDCQLHAIRPTLVENFVQGGASATTGKNDVVDQYDSAIVHVEGQVGKGLNIGNRIGGNIIAVKRNVDYAAGQGSSPNGPRSSGPSAKPAHYRLGQFRLRPGFRNPGAFRPNRAPAFELPLRSLQPEVVRGISWRQDRRTIPLWCNDFS